MKALVIAMGLFLAIALATGCSKEERCTFGETVAPGEGVASGGAALCLGDSVDAARSACGGSAKVLDLGELGVQVACPDRHLAALVSDDGDRAVAVAVFLYSGSDATTGGGLGIGSDQQAVQNELGPPVLVEPFQGTWRYPEQGIAFVFRDEVVAAIQVFTPQP